jgi:type IV secretion system protein VirB5
MTAKTEAMEPTWSPAEAALVDHVANEVYAAHYTERRLSRFIIGTEAFLLLCAFGVIVSLAHRPQINRYIRIDEMGRAQAIAYTDLKYSPREGEVRTYLTDWANYRYTINRETVSTKYPLNYYFLSQPLASQFMGDDNSNHFASQVLAGQVEQSDVEVRNVTITSMSTETVQGATMARGTALVNIDKLYAPRYSREPRKEHWLISVTYYLNPKQVSEESRIFPQFETLNPLGMTITELHENRLAVEAIQPGTNPNATSLSAPATAPEAPSQARQNTGGIR